MLSQLVEQAGMQQTGLALALAALAACVALRTSEGEWGRLLTKPPVGGGRGAAQDGAGRSSVLPSIWVRNFNLFR